MASIEEVRGWFAGRLPEEWFASVPEISVDRDEILIVGELSEPETAKGASKPEKEAAQAGKIQAFREETRSQRMKIADEAQHRFRRKVSWGATCGDLRKLFTHVSAPVMTRLRMPQRKVLDTLVGSGVARSRSHALALCVRLVSEHQEEWLADVDKALEKVTEVRAEGPF